MWSIKLQQLSLVLQSGGPINSDLNEAIVQITDARTCNASHHWTITDRMVCTATCCGGIGPCDVRGS